MSPGHPPQAQLLQYASGALAGPRRTELERHLATCAACQTRVVAAADFGDEPTVESKQDRAQLATTEPAAPAVPEQVPDLMSTQPVRASVLVAGMDEAVRPAAPAGDTLDSTVTVGTTVGRYVVSGRVGRGAMGVVFAAHDPRLDRKVAIKVLRADLPVVETASLRARLTREAQALAKLSHPNVVQVFDVGDHGDSVFIAMDFVEGDTLTKWLATAPRTWREAVDVLLQAGRGLAAAHRVGLVHRDVKPDNVLVGRDGVVRVTDFGFARRVGSAADAADADTITGRGSLVGTPAYMSPEQFDGKPADARSDQFGFCVALYEALYGQPPFGGSTLREIANNVHAGQVRAPPPGRRAPKWLHEVALRGLAVRPEDRFPSMDELLAVVEQRRGRSRRGLALAAVGTVAVAVVAGALGWRELERRRMDPCEQVEARAAAVWGEAQRAQVRGAFAAVDVPWAADSFAAVDHGFTRWSQAWREGYGAACAGAKSGRPEAVADALGQQLCLERQLMQARAWVDLCAQADKATVDAAPAGVATLAQVDPCAGQAVAQPEGATPQARERVAAAYTELATAHALGAAERLPEARALAEEVLAEARREGWRGLEVSALHERGNVLRGQSRLEESTRSFEEAALRAEAARLDEAVVRARAEVTWNLGAEARDIPRAKQALEQAKASLARAGARPGLATRVLAAEAALLRSEGRAREALEVQLEVVAAFRKLYGHESTLFADALNMLSALERRTGKLAEALGHSKECERINRAALGDRHPLVAVAITGRAAVLSTMGEHAQALQAAKESLAIWEAAKDRDASGYHTALFNVGMAHKRLGQLGEAVPYQEQAIAAAEKAPGGPTPVVAEYKTGLAETLQALKRLDEARALADEAMASQEKAYGPDSPNLTMALSIRGGINVDLKRFPEAEADISRALAIMERSEASPVLREATRYDLGRVMWETPARRAEAVKLVTGVRDFFAGKGKGFEGNAAEADAWLKAHRLKKR